MTDAQALAAAAASLLFIPARGWPTWLSRISEQSWQTLLQELRQLHCTGQLSQLSVRMGDLMVSIAAHAAPDVGREWIKLLLEYGVDPSHMAHVHVRA